MINITPLQKDALIEISNVGMSKAAKQLSILLSSHIDISIPEIDVLEISNISSAVAFNSEKILAYVLQRLEGDINGRALLVFHREHTKLLTQSVIGNTPKMTEKEIRACECEAMLEIGNIIITSCISAITNMLTKTVALSVPIYAENTINTLIQEQIDSIGPNSNDAIIMATRLETVGQDISGSLILILTRHSIEKLLLSVGKLLKQ